MEKTRIQVSHPPVSQRQKPTMPEQGLMVLMVGQMAHPDGQKEE
jgi:hypothetical protein